MADSTADWLSSDFLTECLRKEKGIEELVVTSFENSAAAPPGTNYGSIVTRVKVGYKNSPYDSELHYESLIVKSELTQGPLKDLEGEMKKLKEPSFYYNYIPAAKTIADTINFVPNSFFSPRPTVIVMEDLRDQGFVMADRSKQLDFDHCHLYVVAAASFHAVSVAVLKKYPELIEPFKNIKSAEKGKGLDEAINKIGMECFANATETKEKFKNCSGIVRDLIPHVWDLIAETNEPSKVFNTLKQGDPWTTNMMFKYNEDGKVCDIKLIDFQGISYGSPIGDLVFFIWSSANNDVKKHRLKELYRIYIKTLNEKLEYFHCTERFTYSQLEDELERLSPVALFITVALPLFLCPEPVDVGVVLAKKNDWSELEKCIQKKYNPNFCNNYLPHLLESMELNGIFDFLQRR